MSQPGESVTYIAGNKGKRDTYRTPFSMQAAGCCSLSAAMHTLAGLPLSLPSSALISFAPGDRRQAANRQSLDWGEIDAALYNEAFTGRAKLIPRCRYCLDDTHSSKECAVAPEDERPSGRPALAPRGRQAQGSVEICQLFNKPSGNACRYRQCRYTHICSKCHRGSHPAAECEKRRPGRSRSPSPKRGT